jgi:hypothetical protein
MTCRDFERKWNELIDAEAAIVERSTARAAAPDAALSVRSRVLLDHAAECPGCGRKAAQYRTLQSAIRACGPPPAAPAGLADRILSELEAPTASAWPVYAIARRASPRIRVKLSILTAGIAACLVALFVRGRMMPTRPVQVLHPTPALSHGDQSADAKSVPVVYHGLSTALADATAATWDLARSASLPAARISRQVIEAATGPEESSPPVQDSRTNATRVSVSVPSVDSLAPDSAAAAAVLQQVGDRLASGVRPLSTTARHAFGFLLGSTPVKPEVRNNPPSDKGA